MLADPTARVYLIRAAYEWCVDSGFTPYILVYVDDRVEVPKAYVREQRIVLNIGPSSVKGLHIGNEMISFTARFSGKPHQIFVPIDRVLAVYARENAVGLNFPVNPDDFDDPDDDASSDGENPEKALTRPQLHRVK